MFSILAGIFLVILACVLWFGHISLEHSMAIVIGIIGVIIALYGVVPDSWRHL
jgi:uncharacterized membrane protein